VAVAPILETESLQWPASLQIEYRAAKETDRCALTMATAGIAETGTLALVANATTPGTLNFLPEFCMCVVKRSRIVTHMEDAWDLLRAEHDRMPRAVHFVTGPSRTADVEQTLQLGAHGPRQLHVLVLAD
jgi:L-lactate utilization protein LutC